MDKPIPTAALILGLAGLIPLVWGARTLVSPAMATWGLQTFGARFIGPHVQLSYGVVILAFMSGVLWGFATKAEGAQAAAGDGLSVIPALWGFFFTGGGVTSASIYLAAGFAGLLALDWHFWSHGLAPPWWMKLRLLLTTGVLICLGVSIL